MTTGSNRTSPRALLSPLRDDDKLVPHYLRASTGSCHDLCKYGIKHEHEPKKLKPTARRSLGNKEKPGDEHKKTTDTVVKGTRKTTEQKQRTEKVQMPEKLIDSPIGLMKADQESLSLNLDSSSQMSGSSFDNSSVNQAEEPSEDTACTSPYNVLKSNSSSELISNDLTSKPGHLIRGAENFHNSPGRQENSAEAKITGYSWGPTSENGTDYTPIVQNFTTSLYTATDIEVSPRGTITMTTRIPVEDRPPFVPRARVDVKESPNKDVENKPKIPKASTADRIGVKHKNTKSTPSPKANSAKPADKPSDESPRVKIKASPFTHPSNMPGVKTPKGRADGSSGEKHQEKSSITNNAANREADKLKVPDNKAGASGNAKIIKREKVDTDKKPSPDKKNVSEKKTTVFAERGSRQNSPSLSNAVASPTLRAAIKSKILSSVNTVASVMPRVTKKNTALPPNKANASVKPRVLKKQSSISRRTDASINPATSVKLKKAVENSSSMAVPSAVPNGLRNKAKIVRNEDKQAMSTSISIKPRLSKVPSLKLGRTRSISSSSTMKTLTKVLRLGSKGKNSYTADKKGEKIDLMAARQKLRKLRLYSFDKRDGNEASSSKWNQVVKHVLRKDVTDRNLSVVINGEVKRRHRRSASLVSIDMPVTSRASSFREGQVVNPEPKTNNLVRLKFRRPTRLLSNSHSRRSLLRTTSTDPNRRKSEAQTVVLRHQDVQDKKEAQGLFNNVIEETASKLVETKKSKVKALVGAFETVISLQESKAPTVAVP